MASTEHATQRAGNLGRSKPPAARASAAARLKRIILGPPAGPYPECFIAFIVSAAGKLKVQTLRGRGRAGYIAPHRMKPELAQTHRARAESHHLIELLWSSPSSDPCEPFAAALNKAAAGRWRYCLNNLQASPDRVALYADENSGHLAENQGATITTNTGLPAS